MRRRPSFVFIESNTTGTGPRFLAAADDLGFEPTLISTDPRRYPNVLSRCTTVVAGDTSNVERVCDLIATLASRQPIAGIYSSSEYFVETAARVAALFGVPGADPESTACCRNKRLQRERLAAAAVPAPRFAAASSIEETARALRDLTLPIVVKPVSGSGSVGVRLCRNNEEAFGQATALLDRRVNERGLPVPGEVLLEEYVEGAEYSVETINQSAVGITRKHLSNTPTFVEIGHDYPAALSRDADSCLREAALRALSAVGLTCGPAHVELRLTAAGPSIIEINPRLAGGFIPELVLQAHGIDLVRETVRWASGAAPQLTARESRWASIRFILCPADGVISKIAGLEKVRKLPHMVDARIYKAVGEPVAVCGDFRDRVGHVICAGARGDLVAASAEHARDVVDVVVVERGARTACG